MAVTESGNEKYDGIFPNGAVTIEVYGLELAQNMPQLMHAMLQAECLHCF